VVDNKSSVGWSLCSDSGMSGVLRVVEIISVIYLSENASRRESVSEGGGLPSTWVVSATRS